MGSVGRGATALGPVGSVGRRSPDLDFPEGPSYIDKEALGAYIAAYAKAFGVDEVAKFGCRVTDVAPLDAVSRKAQDSGAFWCSKRLPGRQIV